MDWAALDVETEFEGESLGRWVRAQRGAFGELDLEQRDLLVALEMGTAGWDGIERRRGVRERRAAAPGTAVVPVPSGGRSAWRSPERLGAVTGTWLADREPLADDRPFPQVRALLGLPAKRS
ncbi:hypothetical protein ACIA8O_38670 [Kitasatospora sp. NPDC051853]|uniref:hypothetical protein n=1 Tax=Kitasatospora sp. NPDC051853 TaxID=3364058 RepID=UPI00379373AF